MPLLGDIADVVAQPLERRLGGRKHFVALGSAKPLLHLGDDGDAQFILAAKVMIEVALADARNFQHVLDAGTFEALPIDHPGGEFNDVLSSIAHSSPAPVVTNYWSDAPAFATQRHPASPPA